MPQMIIGFGKNNNFNLTFEVEPTPVANLWLERMSQRHNWSMDNPDRFYAFNNLNHEVSTALMSMQYYIDVVNQYSPVIDRTLTSVDDQDTLNYLHNIFERYHGQLDQQKHDYWLSAPEEVRQALANINLTVHRCESLRYGKLCPRFVCTWFGMPKIKTLDLNLQDQYGVAGSEFGGVYLNYCEIGKTATDMALDNDTYMADKMFQPFSHYSADFRVDLYTETADIINDRQQRTSEYVNSNLQFFNRFGIDDSDDTRVRFLKFKVAQLVYESQNKEYIISQIRDNQYVYSVEIE